jgi:formiminotetrahydrofolate cyclodeaminase
VKNILSQLDGLRATLRQAIEEDAQSFNGVLKAMRLPKETDAEKLARETAIQEATKHAVAVPLRTAEQSFAVLELLGDLAEVGNPNVLTDLAVGGQLAALAIRGAYYNILTNLANITDSEFVEEHRNKTENLLQRAQEMAGEIEHCLMKGLK